jgi:hypothetical protein
MTIDFLFLRSYGEENALSRVQSTPLHEGLLSLGENSQLIQYEKTSDIDIKKPKNLIVHYDDDMSLYLAKQIKDITNCKIICLGSDVYSIDRYRDILKFSDIMLTPTNLHREVIQPSTNKPVITIPESVDSISLPTNGEILENKSNKICWFGYPESFSKSTKYILEEMQLDGYNINNNFEIITKENCIVLDECIHHKFDPLTFYNVTASFGYALLSHFTYDHHINTFIKSPNKLITSIVRGLIPIASNTANYREIMRMIGLEQFLLEKPGDFLKKMRSLCFESDFQKMQIRTASEILKAQFSPQRNAQIFLNSI